MFTLKNKVVIITGAGTGLGKQMALRFAKEGAKIAICSRKQANMDLMKQQLLSITSEESMLVQTADVSVESQVKRFIQSVYDKFGRIDILINNAAIFEQYSIVDTSLDTWNAHIENNVTSVFLMMRECIKLMRIQKSGKIINLTTSLTKEGAAGFGPYSASKAAVETLSYSVDDEEAKNGIHIHVVNPGVMKSGLHAIGEDPANVVPYLIHLAVSNIPVERHPIHIEDLQIQV